jgi:signal peptidase I
VRRATDLRRQVRRLVNEQRDQLSDAAIGAISEADAPLGNSLARGEARAVLLDRMAHLEAVANEQLLPCPYGSLRENVKEIAVAVTVIFAFTTFFLQLTKIPTNSLLPTLYGITMQDLHTDPNATIPSWPARVAQYWIRGISYYHITAQSDGTLEQVEPPQTVLPFVKKLRLRVGPEWYTLWLPPERIEERLPVGRHFHAGEDILKLKVRAGDHLLVDRVSYNFRRPQRGEIFVFKTRGIDSDRVPEGQLYIKRLVALPGEHVRIGDDQHLIINGHRLDASTPHFENVYTFPPEYHEGQYFGHVNEVVAKRNHHPNLAPLFRDQNAVHVVGPRHYLAMGDNTMNSSDSRTWGDVPRENIIGKCWFVYWPFTERFGWGTR